MEYSRKCFIDKSLIIKSHVCNIIVIGALSLLLTFAMAIYGYASESLTLEQAVTIAIKNNPGLKAADAQVEVADAGVLRSASGFLPKVTVSETWSRTDNPLMVLGTKLNQQIVTPMDFNPSVINNPDPITNYNSRIMFTQPIFSGGKEYIGRTQAKLSREASLQDRERARQETVYNVIKAYYGLLLAREYYKVANKSLETSQANVKLAEARYKAGAVLQSDLLRAKVQLAEIGRAHV
jgi:outer membrane protein TolC